MSEHPADADARCSRQVMLLFWPIAALALLLRTLWLDSIPSGLDWDQSVNVTDALTIFMGTFPVFFEGNTGREALYFYFLAPAVAALGPGVVPVRIVPVFFGMLIVAGAWLLGREMLGVRVGLLTALLTATSYLAITVSRLGYRAISLPALVVVAMFLTWRGIRKGGWWHFPAAGLLLGLALYTYTSGRWVTPGLTVLVLLLLLVAPAGILSRRDRILGGIGCVAAVVVVSLPLLRYYYRNPQMLTYRSDRVAIITPWSPDLASGDTWLATAGRTVESLVAYRPWDIRNVLDRPLIDPVLGLFFVLGLVLVLTRKRRFEGLFLLAWMAVVAGPLTMLQDTPSTLRMIALYPAVFLVTAVGLIDAHDWLAARLPRLQRASVAALTLLLAISAVWSAVDYFGTYASSREGYMYSGGDAREATRAVADVQAGSSPPNRVYLSSGVYYGDPQPYVALVGRNQRVQGFDAHEGVVFPRPGSGRVAYVLNVSQVEKWFRTEGMLPASALADRRYTSDGLEVVRVYALDADSFQPTPDRVLRARFGDALDLLGYDFVRQLDPGRHHQLTLYWRLTASKWYGWNWAATIVDAHDQPIAHTTPSKSIALNDWRTGEDVASWMDLPVPAGTPPGLYYIRLEMTDSGQFGVVRVLDSVGKDAGTALRLGPFRVRGPVEAPAVRLWDRPATLGDTIELAGAELGSGSVRPGGTLDVRLAWRVVGTPTTDYHYFVHVLDSAGKLRAQSDGQPKASTLPTSVWVPGEVISDSIPVTLPPDMPGGSARVIVGLYDLPTGKRLPVIRDGTPAGDFAELGEVHVD